MKKDITLLNADHSVLSKIDLIRAVSLHLDQKVHIEAFYDQSKILHPKLGIKKPKILSLKKYVFVPYREVKLTRKNIFIRDQYLCQYCGKKLTDKEATIDHIVPKHNSGGHGWDNLVTCCKKCNNKKGHPCPPLLCLGTI